MKRSVSNRRLRAIVSAYGVKSLNDKTLRAWVKVIARALYNLGKLDL